MDADRRLCLNSGSLAVARMTTANGHDIHFTSVAEAAAAAPDGQTITIVADSTIAAEDVRVVDKSLTITSANNARYTGAIFCEKSEPVKLAVDGLRSGAEACVTLDGVVLDAYLGGNGVFEFKSGVNYYIDEFPDEENVNVHWGLDVLSGYKHLLLDGDFRKWVLVFVDPITGAPAANPLWRLAEPDDVVCSIAVAGGEMEYFDSFDTAILCADETDTVLFEKDQPADIALECAYEAYQKKLYFDVNDYTFGGEFTADGYQVGGDWVGQQEWTDFFQTTFEIQQGIGGSYGFSKVMTP